MEDEPARHARLLREFLDRHRVDRPAAEHLDAEGDELAAAGLRTESGALLFHGRHSTDSKSITALLLLTQVQ
ncbi:TilS substrate-binding domain-containing protein [Tomitella cavernea]|uniref:TilS substrate-binding domain-containing protein n=1 Tax=Tomitella cavernea TaxID=1387982 RepID=UPI0035584B8F